MGIGTAQRQDYEITSREPDIMFGYTKEDSSRTQTRNNVIIPIVNGEIKPSICLDLGSRPTPQPLTRDFRDSNSLENDALNPFIEALSYESYTSKGLTFLTNCEEIGFFKINNSSKEVLMSPLVRFDQVLDRNNTVPHTAQAFLYMDEVDNPDADESPGGLHNLMIDGVKKAHEYRKRNKKEEEEEGKKKENGQSSRSSSGKHKGSGFGAGKKEKKHAEMESWAFFPLVTQVLRECKVTGTVGMRVTGKLTECDYSGEKVVVKVGRDMSNSDERDCCFFHVKHEAKIHEVLEEPQGRVIPRMIQAGFETHFTPSASISEINSHSVGSDGIVTAKYGEGVLKTMCLPQGVCTNVPDFEGERRRTRE